MGSPAMKMQRDALRSKTDLTPFQKANTWIDAVKNVDGYDVNLAIFLLRPSLHLRPPNIYFS